ncbi:preprotein translocase subunit YajC [Planctomicrobium sp. SH664]|uniref:preprotein translocase subunit YajC n=1 Tax=Planctomicrobium sp. SH664 TaxID=3448125 RepID=UPI003F5B5A44
MFHCLTLLTVLAQAEPAAPVDAAPPSGGLTQMLLLLGPVLVVMIGSQIFFGRRESKERQKKEELIAALKKNDPVITIGGILGTVVSVSDDRREVTIRVDDNTKLRMQAEAIRIPVAPPPGDKPA